MKKEEIDKNFSAMAAIDQICSAVSSVLSIDVPRHMDKKQKNKFEFWREETVNLMKKQIQDIIEGIAVYGTKGKNGGKEGADM